MIFRRLVLALVVVLLTSTVVFAAEADWTMGRYDEAQTGYTPQQITLPLTLSWQYNTSKYLNNASAPAVVGGVCYFAAGSDGPRQDDGRLVTVGNRVYAVDTSNGNLKWKFPEGDDPLEGNVRTGITVWEDIVLFGTSDGTLYALNTSEGKVQWKFTTGALIRSTPVVSNGIVFFGSDDNCLYTVNARTGATFWTGGFMTRDDIIAPPALAPGIVVFASMDAHVYAANISTGSLRWSYQLPMSPTRSAPVVSGNSIYITSGPQLYALSTKSGQPRLIIPLPAEAAAPIAVAGESIYVVCRNNQLLAFEISAMGGVKKKWAAPVDMGVSVDAAPTVVGDMVVVGCVHGRIATFSTKTGDLLWSYTIAPSITGNDGKKVSFTDIDACPVYSNGALYVLTSDGSMHCLKNDAADNTGPMVIAPNPAMGTAMSGRPPIFASAIVYDAGTGVDPDSVELYLDETIKLDAKFDLASLKLRYKSPETNVRPLRDGRHSLTIKSADWRGNESSYTWQFLVDNRLEPRKPPTLIKKEPKKRTPRRPVGPNRPQPNPPGPDPNPNPNPPNPPGPSPAGPGSPSRLSGPPAPPGD